MNTRSVFRAMVWVGLMSLASTGLAAEGVWTKKADMPTARICPSTSVVDGKIYAIGGARSIQGTYLSTVEVYDPATDTWTRKTDMPTARNGHAAAAVNGKIYVIGGEPSPQASLATVEEYDPATDTWKRKADIPTKRTFLSACALDGKVYAFGGVTAGHPGAEWNPSTLEVYDPATDTWATRASMPIATCVAGACVLNGKMYVMGGVPEGLVHDPAVSTVQEYDPATDTWKRKANLPTARACLSVSAVGGKVYAIGGGTYGGATFSTVEEYDPASDSWMTMPDMPAARLYLSTAVVNGRIYAIGGAREFYPGSGMSTVEEYDPNPLVFDYNADGIVDCADICMMIDYWGTDEPLYDIAPLPFGDGIVDVQDLILLSEHLFEEILPPDLIAYWKLDETEGDIAYNSIDDNHGILSGNPAWQPDAGQVKGALEFDGIDDFVSTDFVLNPADGPFSVFIWIKGGAAGQELICQADGTGSGETWLGIDSASSCLMTELVSPPIGRFISQPLKSNHIVTDDIWHHIGFVWDGSYRILYIDGTEVAKDVNPSTSLKSADGGLYIGVNKNLDAGTYFSGLIDDVRIYNRIVHP